ncbi:MAG: TatD family hydrolase [Desulfurococcaceae archaeon]|nr:TatD family hydrolase [Desulfurococcaceae archaeon]
MLFADAHLHSNPLRGLGVRNIVKNFKAVGGWFLTIVSLPPSHYGLGSSFDDYVKSIDILVRECAVAREEGVKTKCLAGIHPADLEKLINSQSLRHDEVINLALRVLDYIGKLIKSGVLDGIGEVGRPHYRTTPEGFIVNEILLRHALRLAKDLHAIVHLHLEQGGILTVLSIADLLDSVSLRKDLVLLHHLDIRTAVNAEEVGLRYTLCGKLQLLKEGFKRLKPTYMVESDFIDDPKRPGVAAYPWEIIENQLLLLKEGLVSEDYLLRLNIDNIVKFYGVEPP